MNETPPPQASPGYPKISEEPSGAHQIASMADVKEFKSRAVTEASQAATASVHRQILTSDVKWFGGTVACIIAAAVGTVLWFQAISKADAQEAKETSHKELLMHSALEDSRHAAEEQNIRDIKITVTHIDDYIRNHK
jgi:hypothetical protein